MSRLPIPGSDDGTWGDILNDFLNQEHNPDGTQKDIPQSKITNLVTDLAGKVASSTLTTDGDLLTRSSGVQARITRSAIATDPAFSGTYVASVIVTGHGAIGDGVTDDRAALVTAQGLGENLHFPEGTYRIASALTLSKSMTFAKGAVLKPDSGIIVTITGDIMPTVNMIFDISAGGMVVVGPKARINEVRPQWWGAKGDGLNDDTGAIQSAINAWSDTVTGSLLNGGTVRLGSGIFNLTTSLIIFRRAVRILGEGVATPTDYNSFRPSLGTTLKWEGATGGNGMINIQDSLWCTVEDILFLGDDTSPPLAGIYSESPTTATIGTNAAMLVLRCRFGHWTYTKGALNDGSMEYGIRFGGASNTNNDQFTITDCDFMDCSFAGIAIDNTQSIWGTLYNCHFQLCDKGLVTSASVTAYNLTFNRCVTTDIEVNSTAQVVVFGMWSEHSKCTVRVTGNGGKFTCIGGMCLVDTALMTDTYFAEHQACGGGAQFIWQGFFLNGSKTLKVTGNTSSSKGLVAVRDCTGLDGPSKFDIVASTGTGGLEVDIISRGHRVSRFLLASAVLSITEAELQFTASKMGFYSSAPVTKPAVTGSRGGNAALASLLTALASQGLITDTTS